MTQQYTINITDSDEDGTWKLKTLKVRLLKKPSHQKSCP